MRWFIIGWPTLPICIHWGEPKQRTYRERQNTPIEANRKHSESEQEKATHYSETEFLFHSFIGICILLHCA